MNLTDTSEQEMLINRASAAECHWESEISADPLTLGITDQQGLQVTFGLTRITATPNVSNAIAMAQAAQLTTELALLRESA